MLKPEIVDHSTNQVLHHSIKEIKYMQDYVKKIIHYKHDYFAASTRDEQYKTKTAKLNSLSESLHALQELINSHINHHEYNSKATLNNQSRTITQTGALTTIM